MSHLEFPSDQVQPTPEPKAKVLPEVFAKEASNSLAMAETHFSAFCEERRPENLVAALHFTADAIKAYVEALNREEWGDAPISPEYLNLRAVKERFTEVNEAAPKMGDEYQAIDSWRALVMALGLALQIMDDMPNIEGSPVQSCGSVRLA